MHDDSNSFVTVGSYALGHDAAERQTRAWRCLITSLVLAIVTLSLRASPAGAEELRHTDPAPLAVGMGSGAAALALAAFALPSPQRCSWCKPTALDQALHSPWPASHRRAAANYSHLLSFGMIPAGALDASMTLPLAHSEPHRHAFENVAIVSEAVLVNMALTLTLKKLVARRRPAFFYGRSRSGEFRVHPGQENVSFPSGDTSIAFSFASAATTVAFLRGYPEAPYVLATGATLSTGVALLRVAADVHWPTDVFAGAVLGTLVGVGMPLLLHRRVNDEDNAATMSTPLRPSAPTRPPGFLYSASF